MLTKKHLIIILTITSQFALAQNECDKKTITTQGTTYISTEYKKNQSDNEPQTIISGIFKFTWNGKALNVYRCTKNEFPPYVFNEKACTLRNDIDFTTKKAVLKNLAHDPVLMASVKTDQDMLTLTLSSSIPNESKPGENKTTVVKLNGKTAEINGTKCSESQQAQQGGVRAKSSGSGR